MSGIEREGVVGQEGVREREIESERQIDSWRERERKGMIECRRERV